MELPTHSIFFRGVTNDGENRMFVINQQVYRL
jgi:hypothetical protein